MKLTLMAQKDVQVTDQALQDNYKENEPRYREPQKVSFSEIGVPTQKQAEDVRAMALKPKASFADLAKQYSVAPTQQAGGRLPTLPVDQVVPAEFRDMLLKMKPGEIGQPVKVGSLWWITQLHEVVPAKKLTFEQARERVEADYKGENQKVREGDLFTQLANQSTVRILDPKYAELQRLYAGADLLKSAPGGPPTPGAPGAAPKVEAPKGEAPAAPPAGEAPAPPKAETK